MFANLCSEGWRVVGCLILPRVYTEAEVQRHPHLAGRPVGIHLRGRVWALSIEAEKAGLLAGIPLGQAYVLCAEAELLPHDEGFYRAAQERVLAVCAEYVSTIEPFCLHETFLDLPGAGAPGRAMAEIADAVQAQTGFICQAGAGAS